MNEFVIDIRDKKHWDSLDHQQKILLCHNISIELTNAGMNHMQYGDATWLAMANSDSIELYRNYLDNRCNGIDYSE